MGKETAASGTPHLQGFLILRTKKRMTGVKTLLGLPRMHLEMARGTSPQAADYCKKDGDFLEIGELPRQGLDRMGKNSAQELLLDAKAAIEAGVSWRQLQEQHFIAMTKSHRVLREYWTSVNMRASRVKPRVEVLWGAPGTGKTRYCHDVARWFYDEDVWIYGGGGWFDGYEGQKVAIFDDFYGDVPLGLMLKVLDRYKVQVPIKGAFVPWNPKRIYITSNKPPSLWYKDLTGDQQQALERRFDLVTPVYTNVYDNE